MDNKGSSKRSRFSRRLSRHDAGSTLAPSKQSIKLDVPQRPISVLARHRVHELSDIREFSNSSRATTSKNNTSQLESDVAEKANSNSPQPPEDTKSDAASSEYMTPSDHRDELLHQRFNSHATSAMSLPLQEIPERRSSIGMLTQSIAGSRHASIQDLPSWRTCQETPQTRLIRSNGRADSPVRQALALGAQTSEHLRSSPSRTFVRTVPPINILENGSENHARVEMSVRLPSPLFVGGSTIEGQIELKIDPAASKKVNPVPILISKLSVDVIGVEDIGDGKRHIFLTLASELFDADHPPPPAMVASQTPLQSPELLWETRSAQTIIPFCIHLPLKVGPPPYLSKHASIRYLLCPTASIKIGEKRVDVRRTWNIQILTVHNPEKALGSLPTPLIASDTLVLSQDPSQTVKLTAGLHRQTWVNGGLIFADIHVVNNTSKTFKKIELHLEKTTLWYSHAAATTAEKTASHLRLPRRSETEVVCSTAIKKNKEWQGIQPQSSELRTCELEIPRGHVTIGSGRYFEVRYFIGVIVTVAMFKNIAIQLPVTIIHINSLDILPNSLAQVTASIEAKRSMMASTEPDSQQHVAQYRQGLAFTAARQQSLERTKAGNLISTSCDVRSLTQDVDNSPRRSGRLSGHNTDGSRGLVHTGSPVKIKTGHAGNSSHHHHERHPSCYHCHLAHDNSNRPSTSGTYVGPRLPRLQVSTSGLGFSESEFEIPADSPPRKVMLSEQERKMIHQQRELKMQRDLSIKNSRKDSPGGKKRQTPAETGYVGWKNVAATGVAQQQHTDAGRKGQGSLHGRHGRRMTTTMPLTSKLTAGPRRMRSKTNPDGLQLGILDGNIERVSSINPIQSRQAAKSMDQGSRISRSTEMSGDGAVFGNPTTRRATNRPPPASFMRGMRQL